MDQAPPHAQCSKTQLIEENVGKERRVENSGQVVEWRWSGGEEVM
jgi:hypothetical protein